MRILYTSMLLCAALPLLAERQPLDRYQSIIDRQMFGVPPAGFDPTKPASEVSKSAVVEESAQQAQIKSAIRFSAINVTPDGQTAVGFTDNSDSKNPVHYYLKVGESSNGWLVKEADPVKATMTIAKNDVEVTLSIGGDSSKSGAAQPSTSRPGARRPSRTAPVGLASLRPTSSRPTSLRERRMMREQMRKAQAAEAAEEKAAEDARREEERRRAEEEKAQREAEREEQRAQLQQIQEELHRVRAAKEKEAQRAEAGNAGENGNADEE